MSSAKWRSVCLDLDVFVNSWNERRDHLNQRISTIKIIYCEYLISHRIFGGKQGKTLQFNFVGSTVYMHMYNKEIVGITWHLLRGFTVEFHIQILI